MTDRKLGELIALGEGLTLEFKSSVSHLGREICAFANSHGGRILLGVDDNGKIVGIRNHNRIKSEIQSMARTMDPIFGVSIESAGEVIIVIVPEGRDKPYSSNGKFYLREAANTQQMRRSEIREYFFKEGVIRWDEQPCRKFDINQDFAIKHYREFAGMSGIGHGLDHNDVLANLSVVQPEGFANAGVLMFARSPARFFLQASVTCAVFQGKTKTNIIDQIVFSGSLVRNYRDTLEYLVSHLNTEYHIKGGPRQEVLELPEPALREALINALAHRDYRSTAGVQIHIFLDRVEVINPGGLMPGVTMKNIHQISRPRNLLLFSLLHRMELVERIGSGIQRMRTAMRAYGLKRPLIKDDADLFSVTFFRKGIHESVVRNGVIPSLEGINEGLNEGLRTLYVAIVNSRGAQAKALSAILNGRPVKTIERQIKTLKELNMIERRGSRKTGGYWKVDKK